jgi:hypothetical protein
VHDTITANGSGGAGGSGGDPGAGGGDPPGGEDGATGGGSLLVPSLEATAIVVGTSDGSGPDCWSLPLFAESSFSTDDSCGFGEGSVQPFASFALTALGNHGGPTATRVPQFGSVLRNVVAAEDCTVADDQRLFTRPTEGACEVGAVEVSAPVTLAVTKVPSAASVPAGSQVTFTITVKNTGTGTPHPGVSLVETTCTATPPTEGTFTNTVTATVTDADELPVSASATANVTVVAAQQLARTGTNIAKWAASGVSLITTGSALLLLAPLTGLTGRHLRRRRRWRHSPKKA